MIRQIVFTMIAGVLLLVVFLFARTLSFGEHQATTHPFTDISIEQHTSAKRLAGALRFQTVSLTHQPVALDEFKGLHDYMRKVYPLTDQELERELVNQHSLLYTWEGTDAGLKPILLMAHMDVVPAGPATAWTHPPFGGVVAGGYIWGRGTLDMKQSLIAIMEAVEYLIGAGFEPDRSIYLAFGHDEEIGGYNGAGKIAGLLEAREIELEFTLDEGSAIVEGIIPGIARPAALVGLAEKGRALLELTAHGTGGHGSMPPRQTAVGKLARAIHRLQTSPMPAQIRRPFSDMFDYLAPEMPFLQRVFVANRWLFDPLLVSALGKEKATNAAIRTTLAMTVIKGGETYNVLPTEAKVVGTLRILPGDTIATAIEHARNVIDDADVTLREIGDLASEPSRVSDIDSRGFRAIMKTMRQLFPEAVTAPSLVVTATDSPHYETISENNYRFVPMRVSAEDLKRIHGVDERISVDNYAEIIRFYIQFLRNSAQSN